MSRKFKFKQYVVAAAAAVSLCIGAKQASSAVFATVQVLGNTDGSLNYFPNLSVTAGQTVNYEVVIQLANAGTNSHGPFTLASQTDVTDGVNSIEFDISGTGIGALGTATLAASWLQGPGGPSIGTASGNSLIDNYAAQGPGVFAGAVTPSVVLTGTFTAGTAASQKLALAWNSNPGGFGGIKVNTTGGQTPIQLTPSTELSADPYVGYVPLNLSTVPEPSIMVLGVIATPALLSRRRRN